jgi:hypothetical protein
MSIADGILPMTMDTTLDGGSQAWDHFRQNVLVADLLV